MDHIPLAKEAAGKVQGVKWEVCVLHGNQVVINQDYRKEFLSVEDSYADEFKKCDAEHTEMFKAGASKCLYGRLLLAACCWPLIVGRLLLAACCWPLAVGRLLLPLVVGSLLLAACCCPSANGRLLLAA